MSVILGLGGGQFSTVRYWLSLEYILRVGVGKGKMIDLILTNSLSGCTLPGTTMVIDSWPVYNTLGELDDSSFMHYIGVHKTNFVRPEHPDIHTQGVESFRSRLKMMLCRRQGVKRRVLREHLQEFAWREETPTKQHFTELLLLLARQTK